MIALSGCAVHLRIPARLPCPPLSTDLASSLDVSGPSSSTPAAAAFFDLDKTIIARSSTLAFGRPVLPGGPDHPAGGAAQRVRPVRLSARRAPTQDQMERMRAYLTAMCTGWEVAADPRRSSAETLHEIVDPLVYAEAAELIVEHRAPGARW